jgi:hypothetical protein
MGSCRRLLVVLAALLAAGAVTSGAQAGLVHFRSPSGNINCLVVTGAGSPDIADCLVRTASWAHRPAKPASCDLDWSAFEIDLTRTTVHVGACRGDIGPLCGPGSEHCSVLAYGHALTVGRIRCSSAVSGITCRRLDGRHVGYRIAREGYVVYR